MDKAFAFEFTYSYDDLSVINIVAFMLYTWMMRGKCVKLLVWHAMQIINIAFTFEILLSMDIFLFTAINKNQIKYSDMCGQAAAVPVFSLPKIFILYPFFPEITYYIF